MISCTKFIRATSYEMCICNVNYTAFSEILRNAFGASHPEILKDLVWSETQNGVASHEKGEGSAVYEKNTVSVSWT